MDANNINIIKNLLRNKSSSFKLNTMKVRIVKQARKIAFLTTFFCVAAMLIFVLTSCGSSNRQNETLDAKSRQDVDTKVSQQFNLITTAFENNSRIPDKYATTEVEGGQNISIPLQWQNVPDGTKYFAISFVDISANDWIHWLVVNIPVDINSLQEGASLKMMPKGSVELINSYGYKGYGGPQPPAGSGEHVYVATVYALKRNIENIPDQPSFSQFKSLIKDLVISEASIQGTFSR